MACRLPSSLVHVQPTKSSLRPLCYRIKHKNCFPIATVPQAVLTIKEPATGVEFPLVQKFWIGEETRAMGAGVRSKKIAFLNVKVYAVALYVEAAKAAHELGVRDRGGYFENDDDFTSALVDGAFIKALQIEMVRDVDGATFVEALEEALRPRMSLAGDLSSLEKLRDYFMNAKKLTKGTNIVLLYRTDATLDVLVKIGEEQPVSIASPTLCRALFEVYLGEASVVPEARKEWAKGARALLESEKVKRDSRKGGSG